MDTDDLQRQLDERDELVQVLTRQLEQVVEQLDRHQRSGGMSSRPATGVPADFLKQQQTISEDLSYLVNQWEASQLAGAVGRVELQLEELRDLLTQQLSRAASGHFPTEAHPAAGHYGQYHQSHQSTDQYSEQDDERNLRTPGDELLAEFAPGYEQGDWHAGAGQAPSSPTGYWPTEPDPTYEYYLPDLPELPELVEFDQADTNDLKTGIIERDTFIRTLIEQFRLLHQSATIQPPVDWEQISNAPRELIARMEQRERQLEEQLRLNEVTMSIERAKLAREAAQLQAAKIQLEKQVRSRGHEPVQDPNTPPAPQEKNSNTHEKQRNQKWLNMLRKKD